MELKNRVALVTGAARRIGRAIALRLARAGCHVAVPSPRSAAEADDAIEACRAAGVRADGFPADLADSAAVGELVSQVIADMGRLDVLINNASVFEPQTIDDFDLPAWHRALAVNLTAPMLLTLAARHELRRNRGRVVNLCDISVQRPWPDHLAYMASKGGLETLTRALARALAPEVNVVGIAPGIAEFPDSYDQATRDRLLKRVPLRRAGSPEDIASAVHFVLTEGDYITGSIIPIDGGRHVV